MAAAAHRSRKGLVIGETRLVASVRSDRTGSQRSWLGHARGCAWLSQQRGRVVSSSVGPEVKRFHRSASRTVVWAASLGIAERASALRKQRPVQQSLESPLRLVANGDCEIERTPPGGVSRCRSRKSARGNDGPSPMPAHSSTKRRLALGRSRLIGMSHHAQGRQQQPSIGVLLVEGPRPKHPFAHRRGARCPGSRRSASNIRRAFSF